MICFYLKKHILVILFSNFRLLYMIIPSFLSPAIEEHQFDINKSIISTYDIIVIKSRFKVALLNLFLSL